MQTTGSGKRQRLNFCFLFSDLQTAENHVSRARAGGGTNIYEPLEKVLKQSIPEGRARQVFLLTDGEVSNTQQCINLVKNYSDSIRVFTFGMGSSYDEELVQGIARAGINLLPETFIDIFLFYLGNGTCEAIKNKEDTGSKVISTLRSALQGYLANVEIDLGDWESSDVAPGALTLWPEQIKSLYYGRRYTFYAVKVCII